MDISWCSSWTILLVWLLCNWNTLTLLMFATSKYYDQELLDCFGHDVRCVLLLKLENNNVSKSPLRCCNVSSGAPLMSSWFLSIAGNSCFNLIMSSGYLELQLRSEWNIHPASIETFLRFHFNITILYCCSHTSTKGTFSINLVCIAVLLPLRVHRSR